MANRVFEDRLGLIVVDADRGVDRLPGIAALGVKDVFLPRDSDPSHFAAARAVGLYAHLWAAVDGLSAKDYANRTLLDIQRLKPGAVELNIELPSDPPLAAYIREAFTLVRSNKPNLRVRINVAPFKGIFLTLGLGLTLLTTDPNLYVCEQSYYGDMSRVSEDVALLDLLNHGVPREKATLCYGAAALVPMPGAPGAGMTSRVVGLGTIWTWSNGVKVGALKRGTIFQDDLLADVGLL